MGDRYVLEMLNANNWQLGGENSGHILTLDKHTSGDAIIAALQVLHALKESSKTLTQMRDSLVLYPQVLINVTTQTKLDLSHASIQNAVKKVETALNGNGRVLLRNSGTEPVLRVMVEGKDERAVNHWASRIAASVVDEANVEA